MTKRERMRELYEKADNVKPFAEKDGQVYVSFEDASVLNSVNAEEPSGTGMQTRNRDGSLASTGKRVHAINPNYFFANRYKVNGKKLYVVSGHEPTGFRCIQEQARGRVFVKTVPVYVVVRDKDGNLVLESMTTVSDREFVADYTKTLDHKSMAEILPLITEHGNDITADSMPI